VARGTGARISLTGRERGSATELVATIDRNEFWGGAGSRADQGTCVSSEGDVSSAAARSDYWARMVRLQTAQL